MISSDKVCAWILWLGCVQFFALGAAAAGTGSAAGAVATTPTAPKTSRARPTLRNVFMDVLFCLVKVVTGRPGRRPSAAADLLGEPPPVRLDDGDCRHVDDTGHRR